MKQILAACLCVAAFSAPNSAPAFSLKDASGKRVRLSDFKGKVVVLDFWATWCHGCKEEIPWFVEFQEKYRRSGLAVIGVSMDEDGWKSVRPFLEKNKLNYSIVIGDDAVAKSYRVESMPMTLLLDRQGRVAESHVGVVEKDAFERTIQKLLDSKR